MATTGSRNGNLSQNRRMEKERYPLPDAERDVAASMGVGFDGHFYRYRTFRYERCSDAVNYAKLDRVKPQYQAKVINGSAWEKTVEPTDQEQCEMAALGVGFDGRYFRYESYRYERCADAVNYAKLRNRDNGSTHSFQSNLS